MREYRVIDAWRPRGKNAANGSILSGGTVPFLLKIIIVQRSLQNSVAPGQFQERNSNAVEENDCCKQKSIKFGGNVAFFLRFGPFFYN